MIEVWLPFPPSVNNLFSQARNGRRFRSRSYNRWISSAAPLLMASRIKRQSGRVRVELLLSPPDKRRRDADNYIKPVLDTFVKVGILEDDRHVQSITATWDHERPRGVLVRMEAAP